MLVHLLVMDNSSSIYTDSTWPSVRSPLSRVERMHYSLWGARLRHTSVGRRLSVCGSGRLCPGSNDSRSRCSLTGILEPQGSVPQGLILLVGARFIAWCLRRPFLGVCRRGPRHFWERQAYLGYGHASDPPKKALCHTRLVGGTKDKHRSPPSRVERMYYSLGGPGLGRNPVGRFLSVCRPGRVCPGSCDSRSRCALTGFLESQEAVPEGFKPTWRG